MKRWCSPYLCDGNDDDGGNFSAELTFLHSAESFCGTMSADSQRAADIVAHKASSERHVKLLSMNFQADVSCDVVPDQCRMTSKRLSLVACWHSPSDFQLGFKRRHTKQSFSPHGPWHRLRYARMWFLQTVGGDCVSFTELWDDFIAIRPKSSLSVDCRLFKSVQTAGGARGTTKSRTWDDKKA